MGVGGRSHDPAASPPENGLLYPTYRKLIAPQARSGRMQGWENLLPLAGFEPRISSNPLPAVAPTTLLGVLTQVWPNWNQDTGASYSILSIQLLKSYSVTQHHVGWGTDNVSSKLYTYIHHQEESRVRSITPQAAMQYHLGTIQN